ncbi:MAG: EF-hand domain-containing protein [Sphingobium sp.]
MKTFTTMTLAATLLALLPTTAIAQKANAPKAKAEKADGESRNAGASGHGKNEFLENFDANKDGKVTKEEFAAKRTDKHGEFDLNKNGQINEMEYVAEYTFRLDKQLAEQRGRQIRQAHFRFGVLDTDKDGLLSAAEFNESGDRMFSRLDTNGDGVIDSKDTAKGF